VPFLGVNSFSYCLRRRCRWCPAQLYILCAGGYAPSGDLNDEGYKSGGDFTVSYMSPIKKYYGFGGGIHTYSTESDRPSPDNGKGEFARHINIFWFS